MSEVLRKDQSFKGFETWFAALKMHLKMSLYIAVAILIAQVLLTLILSYLKYGEAWRVLLDFSWMAVKGFEFSYLSNYSFPFFRRLLGETLPLFILSFSLWILYPMIRRKFTQRAKRQSEDRYVRGAQLLTADELNRQIRKDGEKTHITVGNVKMPVSAEPKHMFIIGKPGTGKTITIRRVIEDMRARSNKAVVYDTKGDYLSKFYDPKTDIIFNPLDTRCIGWNLFNEIETAMDIESVSVSLIPPAVSNTDPFWNDAARDVFAGILHYLYKNNAKTNADIWNAVTASAQDINVWLQNTRGGERGYRYIEDASSKQAMSVLAVMMQYVKSFEYMSKTQGDFSLKKWLEDDKGGFIFVTSYEHIEATLRPILSLMVDLLGRKLLSMPDDYDRRVFFVLDEFGSLQRLSTIQKLLTVSRSKGGSCWIGIQDTGQLDKIYTHSGRQTIVNACGNNLIFSVADPDTARFLSDKIGETEYIETEETHSMGVQDNRDGISLIRRKRTEKLILPAQIQNLKDLHGYLKISGYQYAAITLQRRDYPDVADPFICRPDLNLEHIIQQEAEAIAEVGEVIGGDRDYDRSAEKEALKKQMQKKRNKDRDDDRGVEMEFEND